MIQNDKKHNAPFEEKREDTVTIEVRPHPTGGYIGTRRETNETPFKTIEVPRWLADACRALEHRKEHGVHVSRLGGIDALGEFAMHGLRVLMKAFPDRSTGRNEVWAVPRFEVRFSVQN